jgi:hypothetical protein
MLGTSIFAKTPTKTGKAIAASTTIITAAATAGTIEVFKNKLLDNLDDLANNRPPSPGHGEFNLIDTNILINKIHNLDIDSQILIFCIIILLANFIYFA